MMPATTEMCASPMAGGERGGRGGECERVEMESEQVEMSGGRRDGWSEREHDWNGRLSAC